MQKKLNKKGFTIIEVLIVLAIAALILLVVFLAIPALQRSQRNSARVSDASLLAAAINDCLTNNNGNVANCRATGVAAVGYDSAAQANQLTVAPTHSAVVVTGAKDQARWTFGAVCNGAAAALTGSDRQFAVVYLVESGSGEQARCIAS